MSIIYRKSNNIIDFMNCSKSQLNVSYKYWLIKLSIFMWAYGWKVSVCIGWQCTHSRDKNNFIPIYHTVEWTQFFFLELLFQKYCHNVLTDWNILNDSQWESLMFWCEDIPIVWTFCQLLNGEKFSLESEIISLPHKNFNV